MRNRQMFVNLPVRDLERTIGFFTELGFSFNPQFTDDKAACMIVGHDSFVMLLAEPFFKTFTKKPLADASKSTEVLIAISCASDDEVKDLVGKAAHHGGRIPREPQDYGFMYQHAFEDPDGHIFEVFHMRSQP
ncbi:MAG TPA: VOC family protein [Burkholderiales bacterium]|nr:VOC family protein [Burkholderiales bacterium]